MPEFENKFQVIVSKRAAQQLVEHLLRRGALIEDVVYRPADRQILCKVSHIETQSCVRVFS